MTESSQQEEQEQEGLCVHELPACVYALLGEHTAEADSAAVVLLLNTPITDPCDRFAALWNTGLFPFFPPFLCCFDAIFPPQQKTHEIYRHHLLLPLMTSNVSL